MIRILFVNAADTLSEVENRFRPLWPAYLAAYAEKKLGPGKFEFKYLTGSLETELKMFKPQIVGISAVSQNFNYAIRFASTARKSGATVIVGGIHITLLPHNLTTDMDVGVLSEGEDTFAELLGIYLEENGLPTHRLSGVQGIVYHRDGRPVTTAPRPMVASLDDLPQPNRSLIGYQKHDYMFTSRGCPYRCVFCASCRFWDKVRYHSAEYVVQQIGELIDHGVDLITFYDDLFIGNRARLQRISEMVIERGYDKKCSFHCSGRANLIGPDVVQQLKAMHVTSVGMGLESGCDRTLTYLKGHVTVANNRNAVNLLKDAGLEANASFVIGAPDETKAEIMETYDFIRKSRLDFVAVYVLTPLPGTPVWDHALERGMVSEHMDWSLLNVNFETHPENALILSRELSRGEMVRVYKKFRRLRLFKVLKALPHSPLLRELPNILARLVAERARRLFRKITRAGHRGPLEPDRCNPD